MIAEVCWPCVVGLHHECLDTTVPENSVEEEGWLVCCCFKHKDDDAADYAGEKRGVGRPLLDPADVTDPKSTGRRRAAALYPIFPGMTCQWAGLRYAGGGIEPIIGCAGNTLEDTKKGPHAGHRHHGPDKNTLNNSPLNVHLICAWCHNRYHAINNRYYLGERPSADQPWMPDESFGEVKAHDPSTLATPEEIEENERYWASEKVAPALDDPE